MLKLTFENCKKLDVNQFSHSCLKTKWQTLTQRSVIRYSESEQRSDQSNEHMFTFCFFSFSQDVQVDTVLSMKSIVESTPNFQKTSKTLPSKPTHHLRESLTTRCDQYTTSIPLPQCLVRPITDSSLFWRTVISKCVSGKANNGGKKEKKH
jgi:hypothetical protein